MSVRSESSLQTSSDSSSYPRIAEHILSDEITTFKNEVNRFIEKIDGLIEKGKNTLDEGNEILTSLETDPSSRLEDLETRNLEEKFKVEDTVQHNSTTKVSEEGMVSLETDVSSLDRHTVPTFDEPPTEQLIRHATDLLKLQKISSLMDELIAKTQACFGGLPKKKKDIECPTPILEEGNQYQSLSARTEDGEIHETRSNPSDDRPNHEGKCCERRASWERIDEFLMEPLDGTLCDPLPEVEATYLQMPCNCKHCANKLRRKPVVLRTRFHDKPPEGDEVEKKDFSKDEILMMTETSK